MLLAHAPATAPAPAAVVAGVAVLAVGLPLLAAVQRRERRARSGSPTRPAALAGALVALGAALVWPLERYAHDLLLAHMLQHLVLLLVAAPLLVLADPLPVVLAALPGGARRRAGELWRVGLRVGRRSGGILAVALAHVVVVSAWHLPAAYEAAVRSPLLHVAEHASFLAVGVLTWWTVLDRRPGREAAPVVAALAGVVVVAVSGGLLGLLMMFSTTPWYPAYAWRGGGLLGPLGDQQAAGAAMWAAGGPVYLLAVVLLLVRLLRDPAPRPAAPGAAEPEIATVPGRPGGPASGKGCPDHEPVGAGRSEGRWR